jgi:spore germination cell wall hydrolase CwlJ-like protein
LAQIGVAHIVLNRARESNKTVKEIILQPGQFSWTSTKVKVDDPKALLQCFASSVIALQGHDFTDNSTFYHHKSVRPYWRKGLIKVADIGNHKFYKEKKHEHETN